MAKKSKKKNNIWKKAKARQDGLLARREHRSFRMTRRRDYSVKLPMPGYIGLTIDAFKVLKKGQNTFLLLILVGCIAALASASFMAQGRYLEIVALMRESVLATLGEPLTLVGEAGSLIFTVFVNGINNEGEGVNQATVIIGILIWLTSVWYVRRILAGKKITLREGLYNSGGPLVSSAIVFLIGILQASPIFIAIGIEKFAKQGGIMDHGAVAMATTIGLLFLIILSLYWLTSTFIALIIVTLPNTYPMRAIYLAGNLVHGIRLRVLYRMLWLAGIIAFAWAIILGLSITLDILFRSWWDWFINVPFVPMVIMVLAVSSMVFASVYIYILYINLVKARHEKVR